MAEIKLNENVDNIHPISHQLKHYASITNIESWQQVLACYAQLKQQVAPQKVFLVLEYEAQAEYTSMHATEDDRLYFETDQYLQDIEVNDPKWEETYQNICLPKQLEHYIEQLSRADYQKSISDFSEKMQHYDHDDFNAIIDFNLNPLLAIDKPMVVKVADVASDPLKLAILPNGYFAYDFDPFENLAILKCLDGHGFEFIGLGAVLMGWVKTSRFNPDHVDALLKDIVTIYHLSADYQAQLRSLILDNNYLILPYCESPQEYATNFY